MTARMHGPKLTVADLNRHTAAKVDNCADSLPFPLETEPFFIGEYVREPSRIQRPSTDNPIVSRLLSYAGLLAVFAFIGCLFGWRG